MSTYSMSHSGLFHIDEVLLPNHLLFMLKDSFYITSLDTAVHLLMGRRSSNWHKETEAVIFEIIF